MFSQVYSTDLELLRLINTQWTSPFLDKLMALASDFSFWSLPLIVGGIFLAVAGGFREKVFLILVAAALLIGDAGVVQGIRAEVNRGRPWQTVEGVRKVALSGVEICSPVAFEKGRSLPSGHVCNNVAVGLILFLMYGRRANWIWLWVALVSYSRIYTGSHFPSDVLVSVPISLLYTFLICLAARWIWNVYGGRYFPEMFARHPQLFHSLSIW